MELGRRRYGDVEQIVSETIHTLGRRIKLATPLGLGKPVPIVNEFYRRAREDDRLELTILTALSLSPPEPSSELERRLREPIHERLFGDYPPLEYVRDVEEGSLPGNVEVMEFYVQPGSRLDNPRAQQSHVCTNFTHAVRDMMRFGVNVIAQMVTPARSVDGEEPVHSLSCNADLTLDLLDALAYRPHEDHEDYVVLGQVNRNLPFMYGDCLAPSSRFDGLLEAEGYHHQLFGLPGTPLDGTDYAIGMHASRLVQDGGTLQIGIGSLSDALTRMLLLRHQNNERYRTLLDRFRPTSRPTERALIESVGGAAPFEEGLYGATEMLVPGFVQLCRSGILSRDVYDDRVIQEYVNEHNGDERVTLDLLVRLVEEGPVGAEPTAEDLGYLRRFGVLREEVHRDGDEIVLPDGSRVPADLTDLNVLQALEEHGLEDMRVVSGVGGQYNFVAMAQALRGGRSIIMLPSTRTRGGETTSNVVYNYGHTTIARHLRDIVVTEYGIADLRGRTDRGVVEEMLSVTDARFQEELVDRAKSAGKLPPDWTLPEPYRQNTPDKIRSWYEETPEGVLERFPFGTALSEEEIEIAEALRGLQDRLDDWSVSPAYLTALPDVLFTPMRARPYLERMGLDYPDSLRDWGRQKLLLLALKLEGVI